jgi:hypothetical protein
VTIPIEVTVRLGTVVDGGGAGAADVGIDAAPRAARLVPRGRRLEGPDDALPVEGLAPMDVLLYRGQGFISRAIQLFDGTDVSHASIYLGNRAVGEAGWQGVIRNDLATSIAESRWVVARRMKATPLPDPAPVLRRAEAYIRDGAPYGYHQLLLLAFLCITRKVKVTPILDTLVRRVLDGVVGLLNTLLGGGRRVMICSEYVYRCYDEAEPRDPYDLRLQQLAVRPERLEGPSIRRPLGRGVHPESVLAWASHSMAPFGRRPVPVDPASPGPDRRAAARRGFEGPAVAGDLLGEVEDLCQQYLEEVRDGRLAERPAPALSAEALEAVCGAVVRFALAVHGVAREEARAHGRGAEMGEAPDPVRAAFDQIYRAQADFVTPGDLYLAESLFTVGRIERV